MDRKPRRPGLVDDRHVHCSTEAKAVEGAPRNCMDRYSGWIATPLALRLTVRDNNYGTPQTVVGGWRV